MEAAVSSPEASRAHPVTEPQVQLRPGVPDSALHVPGDPTALHWERGSQLPVGNCLFASAVGQGLWDVIVEARSHKPLSCVTLAGRAHRGH